MGELNKIEGVSDSLLYNKWGELVIPQLQYKDEKIAHLGREVAFCTAILERIRQEINFIELIFEERRVIVRTSSNFFLLVICEDTADIPLIKLTMNVLNDEIQGDKEIQKTLRKSQGTRDLLTEAQKDLVWKELWEKISTLA